MSNVIELNARAGRPGPGGCRAGMLETFARHRRVGDDVFWLKENAELLNILECTGLDLPEDALAPFEGFYQRVEARLAFFPQYYRFLLSICLDLEDLGMPGNRGARLVASAARQGLADAELSDLQRAEARRLMLRRGLDPVTWDAGLDARLRRFIARSATFALPNRKAAYELTHIVFYLSEYGRRDPQLSRAARISLEYAGLLAYLEQNMDLLSEICVAMRHAGMVPPREWENWLARELPRFEILTGPQVGVADDYHSYLVCNWLMASAGRPAFLRDPGAGRAAFVHRPAAGPLRAMSEYLFRLGPARRADWGRMRASIAEAVGEAGYAIVAAAEASSDRFGAFFEDFARVEPRGAMA